MSAAAPQVRPRSPRNIHAHLFAALVLACAPTGPDSRIARMGRATCKHRSQRVPRNPGGTNLYGVPLPAAYLRPEIVAKLRASKGSQSIHRARRALERAA